MRAVQHLLVRDEAAVEWLRNSPAGIVVSVNSGVDL
jgi:hypothetical protein